MGSETNQDFTIKTEDAPARVVENDEKRTYYLFREKDPNYPLELIVTEVPPGHTQPYHAHSTIDEITVVLSGEITGLIKDPQTGKVTEHTVKAISFYDPDKQHFHGITATTDGQTKIILEDAETGEITEHDLPYEEGFDAGKAIHTMDNRTDGWCVTATVKKTTPETFSKNPKIFQEDKINH
jgi:uncharacterized cupin superfamily protein